MPPKKNKRDVTDEMSKDDFERARSEENEEDVSLFDFHPTPKNL